MENLNNGRGAQNGEPYVPSNHLDLRNGITRFEFAKANNPVIVQNQLQNFEFASTSILYSNESGKNVDIALYRARQNTNGTITPVNEKSIDRFFLRSGSAYHTPLAMDGWLVHIYGPIMDQDASMSSQKVLYSGFEMRDVANSTITINLEPGDEDPVINVNARQVNTVTDHWIEFVNKTRLVLAITISRPHNANCTTDEYIKYTKYGADNSHKLVADVTVNPRSVWRYHLPTRWFYVEIYETPKTSQGPGYLDSATARPQALPLYGSADSEVILKSLYLCKGEIVVLLNPTVPDTGTDALVIKWDKCTRVSPEEVYNRAGIVMYTEDTSSASKSYLNM